MTTAAVEKSWNYTNIPSLSGGVHTEIDPLLMEEDQLVRGQNIKQDRVGLSQEVPFNNELAEGTDVSLVGTPRDLIQYDTLDNTAVTALLTNNYLYILNNSNFWQPVTDGTANTDLSSSADNGDTSIPVDDDSGFSDGDHIAIQLDNDEYHITTIDGSPSGNSITLADPLPRDADSGDEVYTLDQLSGTDDTPVDLVVMYSQNWLVITNGVDNVKRYDQSTIEDIPNLPSGGLVQARHVAVVENHLILMRTIESSSDKPHRVRWSDKGDPTNWSSGAASFIDLIDTQDVITATEPLGPYQVIYKNDTIIRMEAVEAADITFNFQNMVHGSGALSANAVAVFRDKHIVFDQHRIYAYSGDFSIQPIDDPIFERYLSAESGLGLGNANHIFVRYLESINEVWVGFPFGNDTTTKTILRYLIKDKVWLERPCEYSINFLREYVVFTTTTYNSLSGVTYDDLAGRSYSSFSSAAGVTLLAIGSPTAVILRDITGGVKENGVDLKYLVETKDFNSPHYFMRFDSLDILARCSEDMTVKYSIDQGSTWESLGIVNTGGVYKTTRLHKQIVTRQIRFKLEGSSDGSLFIKGIGFTTKPESAY